MAKDDRYTCGDHGIKCRVVELICWGKKRICSKSKEAFVRLWHILPNCFPVVYTGMFIYMLEWFILLPAVHRSTTQIQWTSMTVLIFFINSPTVESLVICISLRLNFFLYICLLVAFPSLWILCLCLSVFFFFES